MENILECRDLTKRYGKVVALDNLSIQIPRGKIIGLLGPNGSGKTTTINCILSLLEFQEGHIKIFGSDMAPDAYDLKRQIGVVFQEVAIFN